MKKNIISIIWLIHSTTLISFSQEGEALFQSKCATCHTVGKGPLVGPDLKGVNKKYSENWLMEWIKSSQTMIQNGDAKAIKIFEEFYEVAMPDAELTDDEIKDVLKYIKLQSGETVSAIYDRQTDTLLDTIAYRKNKSDDPVANEKKVLKPIKSIDLSFIPVKDSTNHPASILQDTSTEALVQTPFANNPETSLDTASFSGSDNTSKYILSGIVAILLLSVCIILPAMQKYSNKGT